MTSATLCVQGNSIYFTKKCQNYLHRPRELEDYCLYDFVSTYQVKKKGKKNTNLQYLEFLDSHPNKKKEAVVEYTEPQIPIVYHDMFVDAKNFGGELFDENVIYDPDQLHLVEKHCEIVLSLFVPYRKLDDLKVNGSWLEGLRVAHHSERLLIEHVKLLQNMQDSRNSLNTGRLEDTLERQTKPLDPPPNSREEREEIRKDVEDHIENKLSQVLSSLDGVLDTPGKDQRSMATEFTLDALRKGGTRGCGLDNSIKAAAVCSDAALLVEEVVEDTVVSGTKRKQVSKLTDRDRGNPSIEAAKLLCLRIKRIQRMTDKEGSTCHETADGSAASIRGWAKKVFSKDTNQERAFECAIADFVLGYLEEVSFGDVKELREKIMELLVNQSTSDNTDHMNPRSMLQQWRRELRALRGLDNTKDRDRLIMFITGPGGSGKSHVIGQVQQYAAKFCGVIGVPFTRNTIRVTAISGVAATSIRGETLHSACGLKISGGVRKKGSLDMKQDWEDTHMVIVDEISCTSRTVLQDFNTACNVWKEKKQEEKYGGLTVLLCGDFSQLEPVTGKPLFNELGFDQWWHWTNCFVELEGNWRFKDDKEYGQLLKRWRDGEIQESDYDLLDKCVVKEKENNIPAGVNVACPVNKDRVAVNNAVFAHHLKSTCSQTNAPPPSHTILICGGEPRWSCNGKGLTEAAKLTLYNQIGDLNCRGSSGGKSGSFGDRFVDPMLKCFVGVRMMMTTNLDVKKGLANGTLCQLRKVMLKRGASKHMKDVKVDGYMVKCIEAQHVDHLLVYVETLKSEVKVFAKQTSCRVKMPFQLLEDTEPVFSYVGIKMTQFDLIINHATTVHKLQGQTLRINNFH